MALTHAGDVTPVANGIKNACNLAKQLRIQLQALLETNSNKAIDWGFGSDKNITSITNIIGPVVTTNANHQLSDGDEVRLFEVSGLLDSNGGVNGRYSIVDLTDTTFELRALDGSQLDWSGRSAHSASTGKVRKVPDYLNESADGNIDGQTFDRDEASNAIGSFAAIDTLFDTHIGNINQIADVEVE